MLGEELVRELDARVRTVLHIWGCSIVSALDMSALEWALIDIVFMLQKKSGGVVSLAIRQYDVSSERVVFGVIARYCNSEWEYAGRFVLAHQGGGYRLETESGGDVAWALYAALSPALRAWEGDVITGIIE